jgi:hypothetical protein
MGYRLQAVIREERDALARLRLVLHERGIAVRVIRIDGRDGTWMRVSTVMDGNAARAGAAARHLLAQSWVRAVEVSGQGRPCDWGRIRVAPNRTPLRWTRRRVARVRWTHHVPTVEVGGPLGTADAAAHELGGRLLGHVVWPVAVATVEAQPRGGGRTAGARARFSSVRR